MHSCWPVCWLVTQQAPNSSGTALGLFLDSGMASLLFLWCGLEFNSNRWSQIILVESLWSDLVVVLLYREIETPVLAERRIHAESSMGAPRLALVEDRSPASLQGDIHS